MSHGNYNDYDVSQSQIDKQTDVRTDERMAGWILLLELRARGGGV